MSYRKILFLSVLVGAAFTVFSPPCSHAAGELIPLYTPPVGGTAYVLGAGVVTVTNKYIPDAHLVHEASTGTLDMVRRMMQRDAGKLPAFAIFGCPDAWKAYKGIDPFAGKPFTNLRAIVFLNASDQYLVVSAKSAIKSYADVKGKRIGIGGPGSTVANSAFLFLENCRGQEERFQTLLLHLQGNGGRHSGRQPRRRLRRGRLPHRHLHGARHEARRKIVPVDEKVLQRSSRNTPTIMGRS